MNNLLILEDKMETHKTSINKLVRYLDKYNEMLFNSTENKNSHVESVILDLKKEIETHQIKIREIRKSIQKRREHLGITLINKGYSTNSDGTNGTYFWTFPVNTSEEKIFVFLEDSGVNTKGDETNINYDCYGKRIMYAIEIMKNKKRILVRQRWSLTL